MNFQGLGRTNPFYAHSQSKAHCFHSKPYASFRLRIGSELRPPGPNLLENVNWKQDKLNMYAVASNKIDCSKRVITARL